MVRFIGRPNPPAPFPTSFASLTGKGGALTSNGFVALNPIVVEVIDFQRSPVSCNEA
jgi:hypothetical protein